MCIIWTYFNSSTNALIDTQDNQICSRKASSSSTNAIKGLSAYSFANFATFSVNLATFQIILAIFCQKHVTRNLATFSVVLYYSKMI